jgi:hypothetical protein
MNVRIRRADDSLRISKKTTEVTRLTASTAATLRARTRVCCVLPISVACELDDLDGAMDARRTSSIMPIVVDFSTDQCRGIRVISCNPTEDDMTPPAKRCSREALSQRSRGYGSNVCCLSWCEWSAPNESFLVSSSLRNPSTRPSPAPCRSRSASERGAGSPR